MEFYIKSSDDPNFDPTKLQSTSEIAQLLAQLEVVLFTNKTEVLGAPGFGCGIENMIFELNYNTSQLKGEIDRQIQKYVPLAKKHNVTTTVEFLSGTARDAIFIDVIIDAQYQIQVVI